ncbi:hypothetical protein CB1_001602003 [Camelus ferus]|nr:hypothetical protein CB1_001602003 [Camelus ferus]
MVVVEEVRLKTQAKDGTTPGLMIATASYLPRGAETEATAKQQRDSAARAPPACVGCGRLPRSQASPVASLELPCKSRVLLGLLLSAPGSSSKATLIGKFRLIP